MTEDQWDGFAIGFPAGWFLCLACYFLLSWIVNRREKKRIDNLIKPYVTGSMTTDEFPQDRNYLLPNVYEFYEGRRCSETNLPVDECICAWHDPKGDRFRARRGT